MAHRIRLRKPWTRYDHSATASVSDAPTNASDPSLQRSEHGLVAHQVDVPDLQKGGDTETVPFAGGQSPGTTMRSTYCRRFHRPTGMEVRDRVQLEVGQARGRLVDIRINAKTIASFAGEEFATTRRYDITDDLEDHNQLEIEIRATDAKPRLQGAVNLWIVNPK